MGRSAKIQWCTSQTVVHRQGHPAVPLQLDPGADGEGDRDAALRRHLGRLVGVQLNGICRRSEAGQGRLRGRPAGPGRRCCAGAGSACGPPGSWSVARRRQAPVPAHAPVPAAGSARPGPLVPRRPAARRRRTGSRDQGRPATRRRPGPPASRSRPRRAWGAPATARARSHLVASAAAPAESSTPAPRPICGRALGPWRAHRLTRRSALAARGRRPPPVPPGRREVGAAGAPGMASPIGKKPASTRRGAGSGTRRPGPSVAPARSRSKR